MRMTLSQIWPCWQYSRILRIVHLHFAELATGWLKNGENVRQIRYTQCFLGR